MASPLAFRADAAQEVVIISDDNGEGAGNLANDFLQANGRKSVVNAIIGLPTSRNLANCDIASIGNEYLTLTRETRGTSLDICSSDWSALINRLSEDIVKRSTSFVLSKKPAENPGFIIKVNNRELAKADWSYNSETNSIIILKQDVIKDGASVSIAYNS